MQVVFSEAAMMLTTGMNNLIKRKP